MSTKCPICQSTINEPTTWHRPQVTAPFHAYSCPRCGDFSVEAFDEKFIPADKPEKVAVLSHWVRSNHENNIRDEEERKPIVLDRDLISSIVKNQPPSPAEQADKFVLWLGNSKYPPGELVGVQADIHQSIMGALTPNGFEYVLTHLIDDGILQGENHGFARAHITLSFKGWEYYEKLKRGIAESRKAFMAMKYNDAQLDKIVDEVFKPAVKQAGFDLVRLDDRPKAGLIDDRLRVEIQTSRFLIADLTHSNLGAYWEAGYAEGLGKPVIYTCDKKVFDNPETKPHFDTNHHLTIPWDENNLQETAEKLKATIRATLPEAAKLTDD